MPNGHKQRLQEMLRLTGEDLKATAKELEAAGAFENKLPGVRSPREILAHIAGGHWLCAHVLNGGTDEGYRPPDPDEHPNLEAWLERLERERENLCATIEAVPDQRLGESLMAWGNTGEQKREMTVAQMVLFYGPIHEAWHTAQLALLADLFSAQNV